MTTSFHSDSIDSSQPTATTSGARLAPYFSRRRDPSELPPSTFLDEGAALFANFRTTFETWAKKSSGKIVFERFGFSTSDDFSLGDDFFAPSNVAAEAILFEESVSGLRFFCVAPISTFEIVFDALLGFDVAAVCGDSTLWTDFIEDSNARLETTTLERQTLNSFWTTFSKRIPRVSFGSNGDVSPYASRNVSGNLESSNFALGNAVVPSSPLASSNPPSEESAGASWRFLGTRTFSAQILGELNDEFYYWERRALVVSNRRFPWTLVFPISPPARALENALASATAVAAFETSESASRRTSEPSESFFSNVSASDPSRSTVPTSPSVSVESLESRRSTTSRLSPKKTSFETPSEGASLRRIDAVFETREVGVEAAPQRVSVRRTVELSVEIARSTARLDDWRALKPGDVLPTNESSDALFLGLLDGEPRFLGLPGLFRGAPAVQIKRFLAPSSEPEK